MKAKLDYGIMGLSGSRDGTIFYYHPRLRATLMRKKPKMPHQEMNDTYRDVAQNLKALQPSAAYKSNFSLYLSKRRDGDENLLVVSWYNLYIKMMWAMQAKYAATVDLRTITREQITLQNLPCKTVKAAIEDGLLPPINGYESLIAEL